ncbi:unnamed protein product, partial [Rotaria sp. Silwood1]
CVLDACGLVVKRVERNIDELLFEEK